MSKAFLTNYVSLYMQHQARLKSQPEKALLDQQQMPSQREAQLVGEASNAISETIKEQQAKR